MEHLPTNQQEHIMMSQQKGQLPRVKGPTMNDRDFINDVLATEKYLTWGYSTALNEFSHREIYTTVKQIMNETQDAQRTLFEAMFNNGWYKLAQEPLDTVALAYNQFTNYKSQFPY
ncbi:MAG TPA: spore coat protein [Bacilli bacterium]|nr:spore coat protein [Bacilli bacterium]